MTIQEFVDKCGYQSGVGYGSAQFDCREALKKDLDKLIANERELLGKCQENNNFVTYSPESLL